MTTPDQVEFIDVSPKQLVSVAAALVPFLENDDANRALDGLEHAASGRAVAASRGAAGRHRHGRRGGPRFRRPPSPPAVPASSIRWTPPVSSCAPPKKTDPTKPGIDIYRLRKFQRSNQSTCINQRPLVKVGDLVQKGDIIADGPSTQLGELALGKNALVAFMPWNGYNFEDSILISERIVRDDVFTSIHIEEFETMARDTKLGSGGNHPRHSQCRRGKPQESRRSRHRLYRRGSEAGRHSGRQGHAEGRDPDDAGRKAAARHLRRKGRRRARHVACACRRASPARSSKCACSTAMASTRTSAPWRSRRAEEERLAEDRDDELAILERNIFTRLSEILLNKTAASGPKGLPADTKITQSVLDTIPRHQWWQIGLRNEKAMAEIEGLRKQYDESKQRLDKRFADKVEKLRRGDELPPGVMKMVKVFVAVKRKLQPGDKMAGRHGNKGVISRIVPIEDMPYLEDGTPVDVVLNPLGVPSRMNVGQILETHLGWACAGLGKQIGDDAGQGRSATESANRCAARSSRSTATTRRLCRNRRRGAAGACATICGPACRSPRRCSTAPRRRTSSTCSIRRG